MLIVTKYDRDAEAARRSHMHLVYFKQVNEARKAYRRLLDLNDPKQAKLHRKYGLAWEMLELAGVTPGCVTLTSAAFYKDYDAAFKKRGCKEGEVQTPAQRKAGTFDAVIFEDVRRDMETDVGHSPIFSDLIRLYVLESGPGKLRKGGRFVCSFKTGSIRAPLLYGGQLFESKADPSVTLLLLVKP
jgi:hypothetical protein